MSTHRDNQAAQQSQSAANDYPNKWKILVILMVGVSLIVLDSTIVAVSLPVIINDLNLNLTEAQWVSSLYSVVFAALLLLMGTLGDKFGRARIFGIGLAIFAIASVIASLASGAGLLIFARGLQGIGGAMILPSTLASINAIFRGPERAAAFGIWGATMASMAAIGPLLGGWLTQSFSWHWIFLINVPIVVLLLIAAFIFIPRDKGQSIDGFDIPGTILSSLAMGATVYGLIEATSLGWWEPKTDTAIAGISPAPLAIIVGLIVLVIFIVVERNRLAAGKPVLLDVSLFSIASFRHGNITAMTVALGEFSALFVLPLYLVSVLGLGTIHAGWVLATMALGSFLSGAAARHVAAKFGPAKTVIIGLALEVIGIVVAGLILGQDTSPVLIAVVLAVYGAGVGLASAQLASVVLAEVPVQSSGMGSATQSTARQIGSALGVAVAGTVLAVDIARRMPDALAAAGAPAPQVDMLTSAASDSAGAAIPGLAQQFGPVIGQALQSGFTDATSMVLYASAAVLAIGLFSSIRLARSAEAALSAH